MKKLYLLFSLLLACTASFAQRSTDVDLEMLGPDTVTVLHNGYVNVNSVLTHMGGDTIKAGDTLAVYLKIDNTITTFYNGSTFDSFLYYTNYTLVTGDTVQANFLPTQISLPIGYHSICLGVKLHNLSNPINDTFLMNNEDCFIVHVTAVSVEEVAIENDIRLYPNPATDVLHIENSEQYKEAVIYNSTGKLIISSSIETGSIDISTLPAGLYFLKLEGDMPSQHHRFIKQ